MSNLERESPIVACRSLMSRPISQRRRSPISTSKQGKRYKPLQRCFRRGEFDYKLIRRDKDIAICSQTWRGCSEPSVCWEVVVVRRHNGKTIKGQWVDPGEFYPSSTEWGKYAFTFTEKGAAFAKRRELSARPVRRRTQ